MPRAGPSTISVAAWPRLRGRSARAKVISAILTDGYENASQKYTQGEIAARIRRQRDRYGWQFLFLGANQDAIATAAQLNIAAHDAATFSEDAAGARASFKSTSRKVSAVRESALAVPAPHRPPMWPCHSRRCWRKRTGRSVLRSELAQEQ